MSLSAFNALLLGQRQNKGEESERKAKDQTRVDKVTQPHQTNNTQKPNKEIKYEQ